MIMPMLLCKTFATNSMKLNFPVGTYGSSVIASVPTSTTIKTINKMMGTNRSEAN